MKKLIIICLLTITALAVNAKNAIYMLVDTGKAATVSVPDQPLIISGSVDTYFKSDFSGHGNIPTSFASDNNSISIGMIDMGLKKTVGDASFVGELSFGPRSDQSIPTAGYHIQNLYVSYNLTAKLTVTAGYMATFVGYEVISPVANFNYSTSYLFTNGPFQNAGFKATYTFSDKVSLMAGLFNDQWNTYASNGKVNTFGAQLTITPVKNWTAYINVVTGPDKGTEIDLTTAFQITDAFKLGLNAADFSASGGLTGGFSGIALYPQLAISKVVTLGVRGEYFKDKTGTYGAFTDSGFGNIYGPGPGGWVTSLTFTANIKAGPLMVIPEIRYDNTSNVSIFTNGSNNPTSSATQFVIAAVYGF